MKLENKNRWLGAVVCSGAMILMATAALAQDYPPAPQNYPQPAQGYPQDQQNYPPPPRFAPQQLDSLVSRVALYPDPLLAQVFAAASFPDQVPDAARWANQYRNLHGNELADAIYRSNLQFDPAVQALLPFPDVLDTMARDMNWTSTLGNAVLADRPAVMDAVQRMRRAAEQYGYLQSNQQMRVVNTGPAVEIVPVDPALIYVPIYDPYIVYAPPRPGFFIGGAIRFGPCFSLSVFNGWGWGGGFNWYNHAVYVNRSVWGRTWYNRGGYIHNYGNWDRGAWRNGYADRLVINNNRNVYRSTTINRYENNSRSYNAGQSAPVQNRGSYQTRNAYTNNGGASQAPAVQNGGFQSRNMYRNPGNYAQPAPTPQSRGGFDRGNSSQTRSAYQQNSTSGFSRSQSAPAAPRVYQRSESSGNMSRSAPAAQNRSAPASHGNEGSHGGDRSGGHRR